MVTAVYILTSLVFIYLVPMQQVTSGETFAAQAGEVLFGARRRVIFVGSGRGRAGMSGGCVMSAPRVYFAMARDGLFVRSVASLHHATRRPRTRSLCRQCLLRYS